MVGVEGLECDDALPAANEGQGQVVEFDHFRRGYRVSLLGVGVVDDIQFFAHDDLRWLGLKKTVEL